MTQRERVKAVLGGQKPDAIPVTVLEDLLPRGSAERMLRNDGVCVIVTHPQPYRIETPGVKRKTITFDEGGHTLHRTELVTPHGELTETVHEAPIEGHSWMEDRPWKSPEDYAAVAYLIGAMQIVPAFEPVAEAQVRWGDDAFYLARVDYSPLQEIVYSVMGLEAFSVEWNERRDSVLELYNLMVEKHRAIFRVLADSPADAVSYDGNVTSELVGMERFDTYLMPCYRELAEMMKAAGKPVGIRLDGDAADLADSVAGLGVDFIDGFTPSPDSDMTVAEAMAYWPGKAIWINFPDSVYVQGSEEVSEALRQILFEAAPGERILIGAADEVMSADLPEHLATIQDVIDREASLPIRWQSRRRDAH